MDGEKNPNQKSVDEENDNHATEEKEIEKIRQENSKLKEEFLRQIRKEREKEIMALNKQMESDRKSLEKKLEKAAEENKVASNNTEGDLSTHESVPGERSSNTGEESLKDIRNKGCGPKICKRSFFSRFRKQDLE